MRLSRSLLHHPDFLKLWLGQAISEFGTRITRDGLPFAAVYMLGATPTQMGLLSAVAAAPVLLLSLLAGAWVDRLRRRPVMIVADVARAVWLTTIPLAALLGQLRLELLFVVVAFNGVFTLFFDVAAQAYLPSLVEREQIVEGNSKLGLSASTAELLGPGLAGVLIQAITAPIAICFDALSFLVSAASVWLIRKPEPAPPSLTTQSHLGREIIEGVRMASGNRYLRALAGSAAILSFFGNFIGALYALYVVRELGFGAAWLGLTITMGGLGSLIGALLAARLVRRLGLGATCIGMLWGMGVGVWFIPLASAAPDSPMFALMCLMISQLFGDAARTIYFINDASLRQTITPDALLGRVNAALQLLTAGVAPLGAIIGGVLGERIGIGATLALAGCGAFLASLWLIASPLRSLRVMPRVGDGGQETGDKG
jgi:Na+/melibiose symporter-like transporter